LILIGNENTKGIEKKLNEVSVEYENTSIEDLPSTIGQNAGNARSFVVVHHLLEFALDAEPRILKEKVYRSMEQNGGMAYLSFMDSAEICYAH
jgi:hypothetical protein